MTAELLQELLWFLPWCWAVNMSLTLLWFAVRRVPLLARWDYPLDCGKTLWDGKRILGDTTTTLGIPYVLLIGFAGEALFPGHYFFILAVLVKVGDALGSFIKRRLGLSRGAYLPIVDHGDYILSAGFGALLLGVITPEALAISWVLTLGSTPAITFLAYRAGVREHPL